MTAVYESCSRCGKKSERLARFYDAVYCLRCLKEAFPIQSSPQDYLDTQDFTEITKEKFKHDITTGIELEVIIPMKLLDDNPVVEQIFYPGSWGISRDTSIHDGRNFGFEYVSPVLYRDYTLAEIKVISSILNRYPFFVNDSCSFHVHVGFFITPNHGINLFSDFPARKKVWYKARKTILIWSKLEALIYAISGPDRINNKYCAPLSSFLSYQDIVSIKNPADLFHIMSGTYKYYSSKYGMNHTFLGLNYRYLSINLNSLPYRGTIEFRTHHGTTNKTEIENWVTFCACLVENGSKLSDKQISKLQITDPDKALAMLGIPENVRQFYIDKTVNFIKKSRRPEWTPLRKILRKDEKSGLSAFILFLHNKIIRNKTLTNKSKFVNTLIKYIREGMPTTFKDKKDIYAAKLLKSIFSSAHAFSIMRMCLFYNTNNLYNNMDFSTMQPVVILKLLRRVMDNTYRSIELDEQDKIIKMFHPLYKKYAYGETFNMNRFLETIHNIPTKNKKDKKERNPDCFDVYRSI